MRKNPKKPVAVARKIRIAAIENDPLRLVGLSAILDSEPDLELYPSDLRTLIRAQDADIIFLGTQLGSQMHEGMTTIKAAWPGVRIIVTGPGNEEAILRALMSGAKGYISESARPSELKEAIRAVASGAVWIPPRVMAAFIEYVTAPVKEPQPKPELITHRERDVLELLALGRSNREIGIALGIGERTVKAHVAKLLRKIGTQNRITLSVHAVTHSLIEPE